MKNKPDAGGWPRDLFILHPSAFILPMCSRAEIRMSRSWPVTLCRTGADTVGRWFDRAGVRVD